MQKQTFKLPKHLALGFAALMIAIMPEANAATAVGSWGFGGQFNVLGTLRPTKPKFKNNDKTKGTIERLAFFAGQEVKKDELELDLENVNFGNSLAIGVAFSGIYQVNDMFGIGGIAEIGISFHKEQWKALKSLTLSEGFFAKIGVAMTITEWFMISAGIRMSYLTADLTFSDEDKKAIFERLADRAIAILKSDDAVSPDDPVVGMLADSEKTTKNTVIAEINTKRRELKKKSEDAVKTETTKLKADLLKKDLPNTSSSTWAFSFYVDGKVFIPLMGDNLKAVITLGFYTDIFAPNFTDWAGSDKDNKDVGIELHGRTGFQAGIGLAYMF